MTKFSKILAVFVAVASLAFVGFAIASSFGGPDWSDVMSAEYFNGYEISKSDGAEPVWQATRGSDSGQVASSKVLPEVLTKVIDEIQQQNQQEVQDLQSREPVLKARIDALLKHQATDEKALQQHIDSLRERFEALAKEESELTSKVTGTAVEARKIERQISSRREDVFRLSQQVEELRADLFRLKEVRAQLRDVDYQLKEHIDRAEQRQKLLNYNPPASG